jgi:hypothetical protein
MIRSVLQKPKKYGLLTGLLLLALLHLSFTTGADEQEMLEWSNRCFSESYDSSGEVKLKKCDWTLTADAFIRLRKTYENGKEEYYSFQLHRLSDMNYLGTADGGKLQFTTKADDIIVQTYNDRKGDIDSMATQLDIPVKNMQPERLDSLQSVINYFKTKEL